MNSLIPANFGPLAAAFQGAPVADDLSSGIQSSFGLVGYRGKVWSIKYRGDEIQLMRDDGDGPRGSIEVVVLSASKNISKIWYEQGYVEGSNAAPDCFSNNGVTPEPTSAKKQCDSCAVCPHNQWGSRITPAGKQGKSCADSKRLAVAPLADLNNEAFGGPMLLRVPAASLQDLAMYGQKMAQLGYPYYAVGTRISFDAAESYPKFEFKAIRPLTDEEAKDVVSLRTGHQVERILSENEFGTPAPAASQPALEDAFEQPPQQASQPAQQSVGDQARAAAAQQAQARTQTTTGFGGATAPVTQQGNTQPSNVGTVENPQVSAQPDPTPEASAAVVEETEEEREERELEEQMKALKAKKAALAKAKKAEEAKAAQQATAGNDAATTAATQQQSEQPPAQSQAANVTASPSSGEAGAFDIESELDDLLSGMLPGN